MRFFIPIYAVFCAWMCYLDIVHPVRLDADVSGKASVVAELPKREEAKKQRQEDRAKRERVRKLSKKGLSK